MTVHRLPVEAGVFARYLRDLVALLDRGGGWCGIFWQRDPDGMRACLDGIEIPPWDVVESLLQDLAGGQGAGFAEAESVRARQLHGAAAAAHDRQPGGREALEERLELMLREQVYATGRAEELVRRLSAEAEGTSAAGQLAHELAWTRDDHTRATARVAELRARLTAVDDRGGGPEYGDWRGPKPDGWSGLAEQREEPEQREWPEQREEPEWPNSVYGHGYPRGDVGPAHRVRSGGPAATDGFAPPAGGTDTGWSAGRQAPHAGPHAEAAPPPDDGWFRPNPEAPAYEAPPVEATPVEAPPEPPAPPPAERPAPAVVKKRRPRGARFAGVEDDGEEIAAVPVLPVAGDVPRGARYGGGAAPDQKEPTAPPPPDGARRAARETVAALGRLRAEGRSGEAHVLLCEAAARPAPWLPLLAAELHRAGLEADWATLLWEAASQPVLRLAAAAGVLADAGRAEDGRQLLRQGVARPAEEIGAAVLALADEGREAQATALLAAFVQVRTAEDAASLAERDPRRLVPQLLAAARAVSTAHERDLVHALRVTGHL